MTEADYSSQIQSYNRQLSEYQSELNSIKQQIDEAEEALREARSYSDKFYDAVDRKKSKGKELIIGNGLRSLLGLSNQITEKLTGAQFNSADQNVQEIITDIKGELSRLYSDYDHYEQMIDTTRERINSTQYQLDSYRRNQAAEATRREEAERARQKEAYRPPQSVGSQGSSKSPNVSSKKRNPLDELGKAFKKIWR